MAEADILRKLLKAQKENKLIKGFRESIKAVKFGDAQEVFVAKNCPAPMIRLLREAADLSEVPLFNLSLDSEELSAQLKKPFKIAVVAIVK